MNLTWAGSLVAGAATSINCTLCPAGAYSGAAGLTSCQSVYFGSWVLRQAHCTSYAGDSCHDASGGRRDSGLQLHSVRGRNLLYSSRWIWTAPKYFMWEKAAWEPRVANHLPVSGSLMSRLPWIKRLSCLWMYTRAIFRVCLVRREGVYLCLEGYHGGRNDAVCYAIAYMKPDWNNRVWWQHMW